MTLPLPAEDGGGRFPGQHAVDERGHWDEATAALVLSRTQRPPDISFFTAQEQAIASALLDRLVGQEPDAQPHIPLVNFVDARLAAAETDGWHYADLPEDAEVWRQGLRFLDEDARERCGTGFATAGREQQEAVLTQLHSTDGTWHGFPAGHVWNLWLRYACTAFYSHPSAWDEIGFPGPAYPRGYANLGMGRREHFEVPDARPGESA